MPMPTPKSKAFTYILKQLRGLGAGMSDELCTSEQAIAALGYLRHSFGGWEIPEAEQRSHLRTFRKATPAEVQDAIEKLKGHGRRPSPAEIESTIAGTRGKPTRRHGDVYLHEIPPEEITPPDAVSVYVAQLKDPTSRLRVGA